MYNLYFAEKPDDNVLECFGMKYDLTDDISQANVLVTGGAEITTDMLLSKLIFAVLDLSHGQVKMPHEMFKDHGIILFTSSGDISEDALRVRDYIENGNITGATDFPDVTLGDFDDDVSRISIVMRDIDEPILLAAMMFRGLFLKAVAGGTKDGYGYALVSSREPVTRVPHVDGVLKVRVLQDI